MATGYRVGARKDTRRRISNGTQPRKQSGFPNRANRFASASPNPTTVKGYEERLETVPVIAESCRGEGAGGDPMDRTRAVQ